MKRHNLKIKAEYAKEKLNGTKPFEIRLNDRDFQVGDEVVYNVIDDNELAKTFANKVYEITYITNYEQKDGYVVFGDKLQKKPRKCPFYKEKEVFYYRYSPITGSPIRGSRIQGYCSGTREQDDCNCRGDRNDCTHYPENRSKK